MCAYIDRPTDASKIPTHHSHMFKPAKWIRGLRGTSKTRAPQDALNGIETKSRGKFNTPERQSESIHNFPQQLVAALRCNGQCGYPQGERQCATPRGCGVSRTNPNGALISTMSSTSLLEKIFEHQPGGSSALTTVRVNCAQSGVNATAARTEQFSEPSTTFNGQINVASS